MHQRPQIRKAASGAAMEEGMTKHQQEYLADLIAAFGFWILSQVTDSFWWSLAFGIAAGIRFCTSMYHKLED